MISEYDRSLHHVSVQDLLSKRALLARSFFIKDLFAMSLCKVSKRDVLARCLYRISKRGLLPLGKISTDFYAMCLYKISKRGVLARSLSKRFLHTLSKGAHLAKSL